jgi:hypothetical protein
VNKVKIFFNSYDQQTRLLFIEAFLFLGWARLLKAMPFSKVAPKLGKQMCESPHEANLTDLKILKHISQAVNIMSKYTFWESQCLVKAIAAKKMLERRNIENTIYLGTAKDEHGQLIAHAWLRSGSFLLTGAEDMRKFTVIGSFSKTYNRNV